MPEHNALTGSSLHDPKAHASSHADGGADAITSLETLVAAVLMKMSTPYVRFIGTEGSAVDYRLVETAGSMKLQKNTGTEGTPTWADLVDIDSNGNLNAVSLKVGGTEVVDSSGDIAVASVPAAALASGPINASGQLDFDTATELTIASGAITATNNYHTIDTQSDGASDDLDTITAGTNVSAGFVLVVQPANAARTVVLKNGTGGADNLDIGADVTLDESYSTYALVYDGSNWRPFSYAAAVTASTITGTLAVGSGGTGATSLTDGGVLLGSGTGAVTATSVLTNGQLLIGDGSTDPALATLTATSNETTITNGSGTITVGLVASPTIGGGNISALDAGNVSAGTLPVSRGGTGATTLTDGGLLVGQGTGAIEALGVATNGQIPIGDGTTDPQLANITGTSNEIEITNGSASIQVGIVTDPTLAGSNISALNGSNISSGTVAPARMGSGTPGSGNFLRGDGAWTAITEGPVTGYVVTLADVANTTTKSHFAQATVADMADGDIMIFEGVCEFGNAKGSNGNANFHLDWNGTNIDLAASGYNFTIYDVGQPDSGYKLIKVIAIRVGSNLYVLPSSAGSARIGSQGIYGWPFDYILNSATTNGMSSIAPDFSSGLVKLQVTLDAADATFFVKGKAIRYTRHAKQS